MQGCRVKLKEGLWGRSSTQMGAGGAKVVLKWADMWGRIFAQMDGWADRAHSVVHQMARSMNTMVYFRV